MYKVYFGEYGFDMFPGAYSDMGDSLSVTLDGKQASLDYIEKIVSNKNNLKLIQIFDPRPALITKFNNRYTEFDKLEVNPNYLISRYDDQGNLDEKYGDAIIITLRRPTVESILQKMQSDLEYMAIISDIDIDSE